MNNNAPFSADHNETIQPSSDNSSTILCLKDIHKSYSQGGSNLHVLQGISLSLSLGESLALTGESGCGKSTLLYTAGLLDKPDNGSIIINGKDCISLSDKKLTKIRRNSLGFIYQFHHLMPDFSALENTMMPLILAKWKKKKARQEATELLESLGLEERLHHRPYALSGGEQQRVAIARALIHRPQIVLADEPTGNLDPENSEIVFNILLQATTARQAGLLVVTHNHALAKRCDRTITIAN